MFKTDTKRATAWLLLIVTVGASILLQAVTSASAAGTTFTVNSTEDTDDGACTALDVEDPSADCTLREAINAANNHGNVGGLPDQIHFDIPGDGPHILHVGLAGSVGPALPHLQDAVVLDGTTQARSTCGDGLAMPRNLMVQIRPTGDYTGWQGLSLTLLAPGSTIKGLAIGGFTGTPGSPGLYVNGDNNTIECNNFGTDGGGMVAVPNQTGMVIWGANNTIGGSSAAQRNIVSGNLGQGLSIGSAGGVANRIVGNYIGTDATGTAALGNGVGIGLNGAQGNFIGSMAPGEGNVISGNINLGISMTPGRSFPWNPSTDPLVNPVQNANGNTITGNLVGVAAAMGGAVPNGRGVLIQDGSNNQIVANTIAHNDAGTDFGWGIVISPTYIDGVQTTLSPVGNRISQNSIFDNRPDAPLGGQGSGQGINANVLRNPPTLSAALLTGGSVALAGNVSGSANAAITIELFKSVVCDGSGRGEGQTYLTTLNLSIPPGSSGTQFNGTLGALVEGDVITATATASDGTTSVFSNCVTVLPPQPSATYTVNVPDDINDGSCTVIHCSLREAISLANSHINITGQPDRIHFAVQGVGPHTIVLTNQLPSLTDPVIIDGLTQLGSQCSATGLLVEVQGNGSLTGAMQIDPGADGSTIQGLALGGFTNGSGRAVMVIRANGNTIRCNHIGTHADGTPFPNAKGVGINDASVQSNNNLFELNTIANHTVFGVAITNPSLPRVGNAFRQNSMYNNPGGGLGIPSTFNPSINGATDPINGFSSVSGSSFVQAPNILVTFEFFASPNCDPSYSGGGERYLMSSQATSGADGVARMGTVSVGPIPTGWVITATATREDTHTTSSFSQCILPTMAVTSITPPTVQWGSDITVVTLDGVGFDLDAVVFVGGGNQSSPRPTLVPESVTPTRIVVKIPASVLGDPARAGVQLIVRRPVAAGGGAAPVKTLNLSSRIDAVSPGSITAPSAGVPITVSGAGFQNANHKIFVRISGDVAPAQELPTTFVNSGSLQATVPSGLLQSGGTVEVTVRHTTANGSVSSNLYPIFVTEQAAPVDAVVVETVVDEVVNVEVVPDGGGTAIVAAETGVGSGTVAVATYEGNPGGVPAFAVSTAEETPNNLTTGTFVDVYVSEGSNFKTMSIEICDPNGGEVVYWYNGTEWAPVESQVPSVTPGCVIITVTESSVPSIADLSGTIFAMAKGYAPVITSTVADYLPVPVGTPVTVAYTDADSVLDDISIVVDWGDSTVNGLASHSYAEPGVYTVIVRVTDEDGGYDTETIEYIVVYDPAAGFVTGGGWINSPAGAYVDEPALTGKATFGFVSQYKKGANVPTGNTQFQFHAAGLDFKSTSYEWLVVAGAKAQYKGFGTINGAGNYRFMLTAIDGDELGGGKPDTFRIRIWDTDSEEPIYDNQRGADENADPTTALGGGSIVVHRK